MRLESLETFERDYRGVRQDRIEFGMAFDKEWNDLYSKPIVGKEGSIELPLPEGHKNWRKINVAHTHPDEYGGTFSPVDINAFRKHRPLSTSAVANEGTYTLAPMHGKKTRWVDFQNAYNNEYVSSMETELDRLDEICRKRGYPRTEEEDNRIRNQVTESMHSWLANSAKDYGFSYKFRKSE